MARPKKKIDENLLKQLAGINCTYDEMARFLSNEEVRVSVKTLRRRYRELIEDARSDGKISIRRKLFWHALEKNSVPALIHLDKTVNKSSEKIIFEGEIDSTHTHRVEEQPSEVQEKLKNLSTEDILQMRNILRKAQPNGQEKAD